MQEFKQHSYKVGLFILITTLAVTGCANYKLGSAPPPPFRTLFVEAAVNDSFAPLAQARVSAEIREAFIRRGQIKLVGEKESADAVLSILLADYRRAPLARDSNDTARAQDYRISLTALLSLYDQNTGNYYFQERPIHSQTIALRGNPYASDTSPSSIESHSYTQSEHLALPRLARDFGRQAADVVLGHW